MLAIVKVSFRVIFKFCHPTKRIKTLISPPVINSKSEVLKATGYQNLYKYLFIFANSTAVLDAIHIVSADQGLRDLNKCGFGSGERKTCFKICNFSQNVRNSEVYLSILTFILKFEEKKLVSFVKLFPMFG